MSRDFAFVQIGAHLGEEARPYAERGGRCLLVEPVPYLYEKLKRKYAAFENVTVLPDVVSDRRGQIELHYFRDIEGMPWWADQIASISRDHLLALGSQDGFPPDHVERITSKRLESLTLNDLCRRFDISSIRILLVDTEGYDAPILMAADLDAVHVEEIIFERKHTDGVRQTTYRYNQLVARLAEYGYEVSRLDAQNDRAVLARDWKLSRERVIEEEARFTHFVTSAPIYPGTSEHCDFGVVYLAIGEANLREVGRSSVMLRITNPGIPITVFTDDPGNALLPSFASIRPIDNEISPFKLKVRAMRQSPYRKTLFLDTDTFILRSIAPVFEMLDDHHLCISKGPRFGYHDGEFRFDAFENERVFNTGVIAFKACDALDVMLDRWIDSMEAQDDTAVSAGIFCDQHYFNHAVVPDSTFTGLRIRVLDNRVWNLRCYALGAAITVAGLDGVIIIHGKPWEAKRFWNIDLLSLASDLLSGINRP